MKRNNANRNTQNKKINNLTRTIFLLVLTLSMGLGFTLTRVSASDQKELPRVGDRYQSEGTWYFVRGVGNKAFEYTATGESLVIQTPGIPGSLVRVPKKGDKIRLDPSIPMLWINGKADKEFKTNTYLKKHAKNKVFLLLEYDRNQSSN